MEIKDGKIRADNGMVITNGNAYGTVVALGIGDSPENWHDITMEEYAAILDAELQKS